MSDFFEVDFLDVETAGSGDAIVLRTSVNGIQTVSVVDGGYTDCSQKIIEHINLYYDNVKEIDNVVLTHPDGDHAAGLKGVLSNYTVNKLWMNRPWVHADALLPHYESYNSCETLTRRLKKKYRHVAELESIAEEYGIEILSAFQGSTIGEFTVSNPTLEQFLHLIIEDDDKADEISETASQRFSAKLMELAKRAVSLVSAAWGEENLPEKQTSFRNEMTIVQYANVCGESILLTGDAGAQALKATIDYAPMMGLQLPGIDRFQVPHHGSRRNVSSDLLDDLLGPIKTSQDANGESFSAIISCAKQDKQHPRQSVVRALIHRGARVVTTEGQDVRTSLNAPARAGWGPLSPLPYPETQEE